LEFEWIDCELRNYNAIKVISNALNITFLNNSSANIDNNNNVDNNIYFVDDEIETKRNFIFEESRNEKLEKALQEVSKMYITSVTATNLHDCCSNVLLLRKQLKKKNFFNIEHIFQWFETNANLLDVNTQYELQQIFLVFQNDSQIEVLKQVLENGKPSGKPGELDTSMIDLIALEKTLQQAIDIEPKDADLRALTDVFEISYSLRFCLKNFIPSEYSSLYSISILDGIKSRKFIL
jgi:hypothetical protein